LKLGFPVLEKMVGELRDRKAFQWMEAGTLDTGMRNPMRKISARWSCEIAKTGRSWPVTF